MPTVKKKAPAKTVFKEKNEKTVKRKGLGGLSPEKKKLLKQLIMQKAAEDLKKQQERAAEEKQRIIDARVPRLEISGMDAKKLDKKVRDLYEVVCRLEEEKYDWETKLSRQCFEMNELNVKTNTTKGHFVKPVLKKVSKTEQKLAKFDQDKVVKVQQSFRENLKSTGQPKFALDEKEVETVKKPEWSRDQLKSKESESDEKKDEAEDESEAEDEEDE